MRCIIHIGPAKTGTSTIQALLRMNRDRLAQRGVFVPPTQTQAHTEFVLACLSELSTGGRALLNFDILPTDDPQQRQQRFAALVSTWMASAAATHSAAIISSEGLAPRSREEITSLRELLRPHCEGFTVIAYLRRQDLALNSKLKTRIRNRGESPAEIIDPARAIDYDELLGSWAQVFGWENVRPICFPDSIAEPVDLIDSFLGAAGLVGENALDLERPERRNQAWDARSIAVLDAVNSLLPPHDAGAISPERRFIERAVVQAFPKIVPFRMARSQAVAICDHHAASNRKVAREWFDREALFHDDFSMYPDRANLTASAADFAAVIVEMARMARGSRAAERRNP